MNLLCPDCQSSVSIDESEPWLRCEACGLKVSLSRIETAPGSAAPFPLVKDLTGESLGGYLLQKLIGVGGMGVVYKARRAPDSDGDSDSDDQSREPPVAVKVLNCDYHWQREEFVSRFQREAKALARLDHPNIVKILDSGQVGDQYYLVTEFVDGVNLAQYLRAHELSLREVVELMTQICGAISFAHEHGIVHRDIKPANVVVSGDRAKVLDFGLAQITGGTTGLSSLTRTDLAMGTINYLSPEQRTNAKRVDERSDVFSLGVVLYEMLTGQLPLGGFEPASRFRRSLGRRGDRIVARALEANPQRRYQSVAELAGDLRRLIHRPTIGRPVALAVVVLASLAAGVGVWRLAGPSGAQRQAEPVTTAQGLVPASEQSPDSEVAPASPPTSPSAARPASSLADTSNKKPKESSTNDAVLQPARTRGLPTVVVDSAGRSHPWLGGKGVYRIRKGAHPVAIIDHLGQRWRWPKGAALTDIYRIWYAGRKGIKGGKRPIKGIKGGKRPIKGIKGGKRPIKGIKGGKRPVKKTWRPPRSRKRPVWPGKTKRFSGRKKTFKRLPPPRRAPPVRRRAMRPTPRYLPRK